MATPSENLDTRDATWMQRLRLDDREALNEIARAHWPALIGFAYDLVGSTDAAEDLAQDALIGLWSQRHRFEGRSSLRTYLMQAIRRLASNDRRHRRLRDRTDVAERILSIHREPTSPDAELAERTLGDAIEVALRELPERRREAFVLVRFHGLSYREAAEVMGVSAQTVANQVCAALKGLRDTLAPHIDPG